MQFASPLPDDRTGIDFAITKLMDAVGGMSRGQFIGSTDATASETGRSPVAVEDLLTTVYHQMGMNADKELMALGGRSIKFIDGGGQEILGCASSRAAGAAM